MNDMRRPQLLCTRGARCLTLSPYIFTCLLSGLHHVQKTEDIATNLFKLPVAPLPSSSYLVKSSVFYTTSCQVIHEQKELNCNTDKVKDSTDILRNWGCSENDISKIFERRPSLRKAEFQILQSKLEILSNLGIKSADLVKMVHCRPRFLNCRINIGLEERIKYFEDLFGSREVLIKALVRNPSLLTYDIHNKVKPVIAIYETLGLCKSDLIAMLLSRPTLIPRTNLDDEKIDCIRKTGVPKESKMYKHVVSLFAISRKKTIQEKVMNLEKYGLSEDDIFGLVGRSPMVLTLSIDKIQRNMTFIMGTLRLQACVVLSNPYLLYFNLETVLKPRFLVACKIEDMGLAPRMKGPELLTALRMTEKRFVSMYISCHPKDVAKELNTVYVNAKCVRRLAETSKRSFRGRFPF
ncbi:uncharacterized protein LOC127244431 [Andrographis paniculata]|uniref:uncharacterized protein LOC127244431 n=1 Tax=Andrographis paniculata TaxID=175694 RepID=UPI0021E9AD13|nr:uncharacterized protein LOC127244431 [Andrographis paniculata]XP_051120928.1 uncharacterized protein LOC127244431 [Andrographis paniculata]XP_051120929.1 uncharacterized protein LOC127244431 [Andrographis paniculata]XP_051120930.1 uncharacterized protein LOC127244431 [Andrographis paniculata]XP_051120931.1 uncharacterized protein LOC127244431 [Andrographis paniculata]XP_051120932.1 uncharacterized protein LOC127244431 [Andrographis paniculata]XP_051120933.1 uncharacterized protein LOC12724